MHGIAPTSRDVIGGVDTHQDLHTAAVVDAVGEVLGTQAFATTRAGYRAMLAWFASHGRLLRVGIEATGTYGAGLARHLDAADVVVLEIERPARRLRRQRGKSDEIDAEAAARAVLAGTAQALPKGRHGIVESIRTLRTVRRGAIKARSAAINSLKTMVVSAPAEQRERLDSLSTRALVATCAALRPDHERLADALQGTKAALRSLAGRITAFEGEIAELDAALTELVRRAAPQTIGLMAVGVEHAGQLLVTAGDNPERRCSEAAFAHLCGVAPIPASSGRTTRQRLHRGGDRAANRALHMALVVRLRPDPRRRAYVARRTKEGLSKMESIRCLKRYLAREVYRALRADLENLNGA